MENINELKNKLQKVKEQAIKRSGVLELAHPEDTMLTLGGFDSFKAWVFGVESRSRIKRWLYNQK